MWMVECLHVAGRILSFVSVNETSMFRASSGQSREAVGCEGPAFQLFRSSEAVKQGTKDCSRFVFASAVRFSFYVERCTLACERYMMAYSRSLITIENYNVFGRRACPCTSF